MLNPDRYSLKLCLYSVAMTNNNNADVLTYNSMYNITCIIQKKNEK